jgi:hypothetical protein
MNRFQMGRVREFIAEAHRPLGKREMKKVRKVVRKFLAHVQHLMQMELDGMARQEGSSGLRWFNSIDVLAVTIRGRATLEAQNITK